MSERTGRDTVALALAILGASMWAIFPLTALLLGEGVSREVGRSVAFAAGAALGSWTAATVWKHVQWQTAAIVAGLITAAMMAMVVYQYTGAFVPGWSHVLCVGGAATGAAAGTVLGWRAREARRVLASVWITMGVPALVGMFLFLLFALDYTVGNHAVWIMLVSFGVGARVAAWICGGVPPKTFAIALGGPLFLAVAIANTSKVSSENVGSAILGCLFWTALPVFIATIPMRRAHAQQPAPAEMPTATVVDR